MYNGLCTGCDLLWVSTRVFVKHTVGFCVVSCSVVGSVVVYCGLQWDVSGLYSGLCITFLVVGFIKGVLEAHSGFCGVSWSAVGSAGVGCRVQCCLAVGKRCKLDQVYQFSEILTVCKGLDVALLLGELV